MLTFAFEGVNLLLGRSEAGCVSAFVVEVVADVGGGELLDGAARRESALQDIVALAGDGAVAEVVVVFEGPELGDERVKCLLVVVELLDLA